MIEREFQNRAAKIPHHGHGLSVDAYTPDLFEVLEALRRRELEPDYLELFKADDAVLGVVRRRVPAGLLEYHAEGLWVTQPGWETSPGSEEALDAAIHHAALLGCAWITHECAAKEMAGYAFGTYLPPLFTEASAEVTARQIALVQRHLDRSGDGPLFLLEVPPLTYLSFGDLSVAEFFSRVAEQVACGITLDIGHLWTIYRYTGEWRRRSLQTFLAEFLDQFPMHRVVQIHVAGLASEPGEPGDGSLPWWLDAHHAPIPEVLFEMLDQVLTHPALRSLKGLALEVDTKAIPLIATEYADFQGRYGWWSGSEQSRATQEPERASSRSAGRATGADLKAQYRRYAEVLVGRLTADAAGLATPGLAPGALDRYRRRLSNEILHWGGDLQDMFPDTCRALAEAGIELSAFVDYWYRQPRPVQPYDFFLLKLERFPAFVGEMLPGAASRAVGQAQELRAAYDAANKGLLTVPREA